MKCLVAVKRVIDYNVKIRVKSDLTGVETEQVKMSMNPFDEIALEEAVLQKEKGLLEEIIVVSVGVKACTDILRMALARGATRAILIETPINFPLEPLNVALILKALIEKESPDVVMMGKQAIDDDCNQTGQMLAGLLAWPQGTFVSRINFNLDNKTLEVARETDEGLEIRILQLPAVVTVDLRLNEPRYISLPNVMKAKNKPLEVLPVSEFNGQLKPHLKILKVESPPLRKGGVKVATVQELLDKLQNEAKVL